MRLENEFTIADNATSSGKLQTPVDFPDGQKCTRIRDKVSVVLSSTDAAAYVITNADAIDIMQALWGAVYLHFGDQQKDHQFSGEDFDRMREMCIALTGRDVLFNGKELKDYSSSDSDKVTVPATGTVTVTCELVIPYLYERLGPAIDTWCPGASQMRQLHLKVKRAALASIDAGKVTFSGNSTHAIYFDVMRAQEDSWKPVPKIFTSENTGLGHKGPGGAILLVAEFTAAGDSTALTTVSVGFDDMVYHDHVEASEVVDISKIKAPLGSYDLNNLLTVLYQPEGEVGIEDLITADEVEVSQLSSDLDPFKLLVISVEETDDLFVDKVVAGNVADAGPVKLVNEPATQGKAVRPGTAAVTGIAILRDDNPRFDLLPGLAVQKGRKVQLSYPAAVIAHAASVQDAAGDRAASALADFSAKAAAAIPAASTAGGKSNPRTEQITRDLAKDAGTGSVATGLLARLFRGRRG